MTIKVTKDKFPLILPLLQVPKGSQQYNIPGYKYENDTLTIPNLDIQIEKVVSFAQIGSEITGFSVWFEIPDANINDFIPDDVSFKVPGGIPDTWNELSLGAQGATMSLRYWQPFNDGIFNFTDIVAIQNAGFKVYGQADYILRLDDAEYTAEPINIKTIEYINDNWQSNGFFDYVDAHNEMTAVYEAKGVDDNARWAACTDDEKFIIVKWNIVGLGKASTLPGIGSTEAQIFKSIGRLYRENNINVKIALERRFTDWYQYLNMVLAASGRTKFDTDWNWNLSGQYISRYLRQFELGVVNDLVDFNNNTLGGVGYDDSDFFGTISKAAIINNLEDVLIANEYFI